MTSQVKMLTQEEVEKIESIEEGHFNDFKAKDLEPKKLSKTVSAFGNASGGDIYLGIREDNKTKIKYWEGFEHQEDANAFLQVIYSIPQVENYIDFEFFQHPGYTTFFLRITVFKTLSIVPTADNKIYVRKGAQNLPVDTEEKKRRLELDKGITSYEDEPIAQSRISDATESEVYRLFMHQIVPGADPEGWLDKQRLTSDGKLTVAGELLFSDEPQICLPKRSSIKIFRYKTSGTADRDTLDGQPITIEGCAYRQIYDAVAKVKDVIETIKRLGATLESIQYPEETLHEIITNAVLHRDYSMATDIQIRIFDNRVEVESPGKLPGHVTVENILDSQAARNPKIVRLINKFPEAPNKDVGEGLNTAFAAMEKLRLKSPEISEKDNSVLVTIKHEKLASPEEIVIEYLRHHDRIKNGIGREITGIKSENSMKQVFYRLRERGFITLVKGDNYWVKTDQFDKLANNRSDY